MEAIGKTNFESPSNKKRNTEEEGYKDLPGKSLQGILIMAEMTTSRFAGAGDMCESPTQIGVNLAFCCKT